jgi:hypothetical protein
LRFPFPPLIGAFVLLLGTVGANDGAEEQTAVGGGPKSDYDDDN